ncbi:hypothetical protein MKX01_015035 [Papaver californicum]|nr:hypothetical protein MKX01_015035 [Papaver californicum]
MGAPKQKWTAAEEAALKAGILKHGTGKWRQILKDPEFNGILILRSNVDLKDHYCAPPNFKRILSAKLKFFIAIEKVIKVNRKYRIAPDSGSYEKSKIPEMLPLEAMQGDSPDINKDGDKIITRTYINSELAAMRFMTAQQAGAAAARAAAEAEARIAIAEQAAMEAEAEEALAEEAKMTLRAKNASLNHMLQP